MALKQLGNQKIVRREEGGGRGGVPIPMATNYYF
jgi:hypothetical protein